MKAAGWVWGAVLVWVGSAWGEDARQLAPLPEPAQAVLRQEMLDNMVALNEILSLMADGQVKAAGQVAEAKLGRSAMGKNRALPFEARPGAHMPQAMHEIGLSGHQAASEFARAAARGDQEGAMALLPSLTATCVACHLSYRAR